ncbi:hypothetical protein ACERII_09450 [Evansella sp. AB-rgal1]|uniref:hypothetical protein n=1 Tax=Evansella sp. AB-rgal1 TaxID=3242696 RepID=UPI00359ECF73
MNTTESLLWSIALPGFPQILNGRYVKGFIFVFLEILINVQANFNEIIIFSFLGDIEQAITNTNYLWLMFYPCLYFFAMYDAYRDAGGNKQRYSSIPFVFCAYFVTFGLILSPKFTIFGHLIGPMWLPMSFVIPGLIVGTIIKKVLIKKEAY